VARAVLAALRKAPEPLSIAQAAQAVKASYPDAGWNLARWLQAVRRAQAARPDWFAAHGEGKLAVGKGAGGVGPRAGLTPAADGEAAPPPPAPAAADDGIRVASETTDLEDDLFGNLDDL